MELERALAVTVMLLVGIGTFLVGYLGRGGRLDYVLGGWTEQTTTPESWADAHVTIGTSFMLAGVVAGLTGLVALVVPLGAIGPVVVAGSVVPLVPVVVGVVIGTGRLRRR
jgi:hypothetical protein